MIDMDGDRAKVRANLIGVHVHQAGRPESHYDIGERYGFEMVRTGEGWRVSRMTTEPVWNLGPPPA